MEISLLHIFVVAFLASFGHCIGMCGGIVLAYSAILARDSRLPLWLLYGISHLCYHSGKITSYAILGGIAGGLGGFFTLNMFVKHIVFLFIGILLVFIGLSMSWLPRFKRIFNKFLNAKFNNIYQQIFGQFLGQHSMRAIFMLGICNGLLPCGVVYFFLLSASVSGGVWQGMVVMAIFGIATMPSLLLIVVLGGILQHLRLVFLRLCSVGMIGFGVYEIYKSLSGLFS